MNSKNSQKGQMVIVLILGVVIVGSFLMVGGFSSQSPKSQTENISNQNPVEPGSSNAQTSSSTSVGIASQENTCSHLDGVCHPLDQAFCCDRVRALCANEKCSGYLPPENTYTPGNPTPTIDPACGIDDLCKSICADKEGFLCL